MILFKLFFVKLFLKLTQKFLHLDSARCDIF